MKIGDILTRKQLDQLPVGSVVVYDEDDGRYFNTIIRTPSGFSWIDQSGDRSNHVKHELGGIYVDGWKLVHLPAVPALKVGDTVTSEEQVRALPIGSVVVDTTDAAPHRAAAIKVGDDKWLFDGVLPSGPQHCSDADVYGSGEDVVVYIPEAAAG